MASSCPQHQSSTPNRYSEYDMSGTKARSPKQSANMAAFKLPGTTTKERISDSDKGKIKELEEQLRIRDKKISELMRQIRNLEEIKQCSVPMSKVAVEIAGTSAAATTRVESVEMSQGGIDLDDKTKYLEEKVKNLS